MIALHSVGSMSRKKRKQPKVEEPEDYFGEKDPKNMPGYFFYGAVHVEYRTAKRAVIEKQDFSMVPRFWYIDADFRCDACRKEFTWSADEQKAWFERYGYYVDAQPRHCKKCRAEHRVLTRLRKEYDALVGEARDGGSAPQKQRIIEIVDQLEAALAKLPERMQETRRLFQRQLEKVKSAEE